MHGQQNIQFSSESFVTRSHLFVFPVLCIQTTVTVSDPKRSRLADTCDVSRVKYTV